MKKRIFAVVSLLFAVVCLGGCSSNVEWVTETYEELAFQIPVTWEENSEGYYTSTEGNDGMNEGLALDSDPFMAYESDREWVENLKSLQEDATLTAEGQTAIAGIRAYYLSFQELFEGQSHTSRYYVFETNSYIYRLTFYDCSDDIIEKVVNSIQINN